MISPESIARYAEGYCARSIEPLVAFWVFEPTRRTQLCIELRELDSSFALVPVIVHGGMRFLHPNALSDDIRGIMDENKASFDEVFAQSDAPPETTVLVLISRTKLGIAQASSPVEVPEWFPRIGGKSIQVSIIDLEFEPMCPLGAQEASVDQLSASLHFLEKTLVTRLVSISHRDPGMGESLLVHLKTTDSDDTDWEQFLVGATSFADRIRPPEAYRPSFRFPDSLVSRLLSITARTTPDRLGRIAKALAIALDLPEWQEMPAGESLPSVLLRPTGRTEARVRFARDCIATIYATAQYITAAAHSDEYGKYPTALVVHTSRNLQATCTSIASAIMDL